MTACFPRRPSRPSNLAAVAFMTAALSACDPPELEDLDENAPVTPRDGVGNGGPILNTNVLIGTDVPAVDTHGGLLGGVRLTGISLLRNGAYVPMDTERLTVDHGTLKGHLGNGPLYVLVRGVDFIGSRWHFVVNGQLVIATLTAVETSGSVGLYNPTHPSRILELDPERLVYTFQYDQNGDLPVTTCAADADGGARMVIYGDIIVDENTGDVTSREHTVYFGCISGATGKAALWGYAPDSPSLPSVSLAGFETGIRVVRADYCADGDSYTVAGNALTLRDRWGINTPPPLPFTTEAVWEEGTGAVCLRRIRGTGATLLAPHVCPDGSQIPLCPTAPILTGWWAGGYGDFWTKIP